MTYAILLCRKKEPSESSDSLALIEQVLMQALHELRTQIISPMTDELKTDKEEDADELFQQHIEAQCKRLRILGLTGTPIIRGNLNAMDKSLLPSLQTVCTEILNNIAKHGKPGAFAFILSVGPDAVRIFASNLYNAAINSAPENHYGTALIQDFAQQHNGTMPINSENEEWSLSLAIPLTHQTH